jgi:hypothetical protein
VEVDVHESVDGSYLPPVLVPPPQTIISVPVHTAVCDERADGTLTPVEVGLQTFVTGS